jgi:hypothetical protein
MASRLRSVTLANLKPAPGSRHSVCTTSATFQILAELSSTAKTCRERSSLWLWTYCWTGFKRSKVPIRTWHKTWF